MTDFKKVEELLREKEKELLEAWIKAQLASVTLREDLMSVEDLRRESTEFLRYFVKAVQKGNLEDITAPEYASAIERLNNLSKSRAVKGFTPSETATYIFSLKDSILSLLQKEYKSKPERMAQEIIRISKLLNKLGLVTFEEYVKGREEFVKKQQESILELSSPIVTLWESILAVPIIGVLDSKRTKTIMENLLNKIIVTGSKFAIIDITGVSVMDTLVATHLLKTVGAVRLLGGEAVITGIQPEVAQTVVQLGVDLTDVVTRASMAEGLHFAINQLGDTPAKERV